MADRLEIFMTRKGTSVRCPALYKYDVPTISCVNKRSHCDFYIDLEANRRGTKNWIVCSYREKPSARTRTVFGYGKSVTPSQVMIQKGKNWEWLEEELGSDAKKLDDIYRKLMEKARRRS